ncbi:MAG: MobV family relaxase [Clostridia bacterium]|jgi:hypothetical protein
MSFAIIRNTKYKRENLKGIYRHNERKNKNYSNDNIDKERSYLNYSLKSPKYRYDKEFDMMKEKYNLKGQIKTVSNIACEYIITSDKQFFEEIGEEETRRYFETAYKFVSEYKNLGEQYIMSAKVHMDEETPHMHLIFLPVVHTTDKKGNNIDKLACSEFWKEKNSYRRLQDAFYQYMSSHNFELERGIPKEETGRVHIDIKEYKELTNFDETKENLQNMKLELPDVPEIDDIKMVRWSKKRDEKILEDIIKPKNDLINKLYQNNLLMYQQLLRQAKMVEEAEKYQKERNKIMADNRDLHKQVDNIKAEYQQKEDNLEWKYEYRINKLEKENGYLHKVIDKFRETIHKFIEWICVNFDMGTGDTLIRDFEKETRTYLDAEEQIKREEREKDLEMER